MKINKEFLKWINGRPEGRAPVLSTTGEFDYDDYVSWCRENGVAPAAEDSAFLDWCAEEARINYAEDLTLLKGSRFLQGAVVVTGTIGRWNGSFDIVPEVVEDFDSAWRKMTGGDILDVVAEYDTRSIHVAASHHDAVNHYRVWPVREGADRALLEWRIDNRTFDPEGAYDKRFLQPITDYLF